jgi:DNA-binding MarR family transcriptional regulator
MYELLETAYSRLMLVYYKKLFSAKDSEYQDLKAADVSLLEVIHHLNGPRYAQLAKFVNMSLPNLTYRVNRLIEKGYVVRAVDEKDKRVHTLTVTEKFLSIYGLDELFLRALIQDIYEDLSEEERQLAEKIVDKLNRRMKEEPDE